jgi:hypothetical protein
LLFICLSLHQKTFILKIDKLAKKKVIVFARD